MRHGQALNLYWAASSLTRTCGTCGRAPEGHILCAPAQPAAHGYRRVGDMRIPACQVMGPYGDVVPSSPTRAMTSLPASLRPGVGLPATYTEEVITALQTPSST